VLCISELHEIKLQYIRMCVATIDIVMIRCNDICFIRESPQCTVGCCFVMHQSLPSEWFAALPLRFLAMLVNMTIIAKQL
jgi:hypothetical protein